MKAFALIEPQQIVGDLLQAEISEKQARSIRYQMTIAKLPLAKDITEFAFAARRSTRGWCAISPRRVPGPPAQRRAGRRHRHRHRQDASGHRDCPACIRDGARARFYNVIDLVNRLEAEARPAAGPIARLDLVVLDELGYLPFAQSGGQLLFT